MGVEAHEITSMQQLAREVAAIKLEWAEMLDLIQSWAGRQAKRDANAAKKALAAAEEHQHTADNGGAVTMDKSELRRRATALRLQQGRHP